MKRTATTAIGCALATLLTACAPVAEPVAQMPQRAIDRPMAPRQAETDLVGTILQAGFTADARNDGETLYQQAQALIRMGAHGEDGTPDLAEAWLRRAHDLGVAPRDQIGFRGRTLGPGYRQGHIGAHGHFRTHQSFNAGQRAEIVLVPIDDAPLSLDVVDDEGAPICSVAPSTRNLGCRWVPNFTGTSDIDVNNDNDRDVNFYIVLNWIIPARSTSAPGCARSWPRSGHFPIKQIGKFALHLCFNARLIRKVPESFIGTLSGRALAFACKNQPTDCAYIKS